MGEVMANRSNLLLPKSRQLQEIRLDIKADLLILGESERSSEYTGHLRAYSSNTGAECSVGEVGHISIAAPAGLLANETRHLFVADMHVYHML